MDSTSGLNGWVSSSIQHPGAGIPGTQTTLASGVNGCALLTSDIIQPGTALSGGYTMTLGEENMSNATNFVVLVRIALAAGESVTSLSIGEAV